MAKLKLSTKRLQVNKANTQMIVMTGIASAVIVFSLVASRALLGQRAYQSRVIAKKEAALKQLKANVTAVKTLEGSFEDFEAATSNVIGGNPTGSGDRDGDNAKIILDALPSQYDFPALATSLEKLLSTPNYKIESIVGKDDELNQHSNKATATPKSVEMPFEISVSGSYASIQALVSTLEKSIRPFQMLTMEFSGKDADLKLKVSAKTYYQPEKSLTIKTEEIK